MANASCIISVLSENVKVSGEVRVGFPTAVFIGSLQLKDTRTMTNYTVTTFEESGLYNEANYSIVLKNEETYDVTVNFSYGEFYNFNYWPPTLTPFSVTSFLGNTTVYAPAGSSAITGLTLGKNYTF